MEHNLRFFVDGSEFAEKDHIFEYTHAARMIIPRVGEYVWLYSDKESDFGSARFRVTKVEYDCFEHESLGFVDVYVVRDDPDDYEDEEDY